VGDPGLCVVAVAGAADSATPPGLARPLPGCDVRFIATPGDLVTRGADAEVVFVWEPRPEWLPASWDFAGPLRWIAASTVGVDWLLNPELARSGVVVTNSAGVFNDAMAEYALALVSAVCADLHTTIRLQGRREWVHRDTRRLAGCQVVVVGAGGIGRGITRRIRAAGAAVQCVGRHSRLDPELGQVAAVAELPGWLPEADFVILAVPLTPHTRGLFGQPEFALMRGDAWLVNLGRGPLVDEPALLTALQDGTLGGAALDVFPAEPLPAASPLWDLPNVIVSPHMSGDFRGWEKTVTDLFLAQLRRYQAGQPLANVVDKQLGFAPAAVTSPS
jgi:phosphoglycerate dehydrogenase-like enzyme